MLPGREETRIGEVESEFSDSETDEAETHEDGTEDADEEGDIVPPADALVEPLAVMIKHVDTLVTHGAVLGPGRADVDVAQVAPTILYHVVELALVELRHLPPGELSQQSGVAGVDEEADEVGDVVEGEDDNIHNQQRQLDTKMENFEGNGIRKSS